jgi:hypothetical protein
LANRSISKRARFGVECLDIGQDSLSPVSASYEHKLPFKFTGTIEKVIIDIKPQNQAAYEKESRAASVAHLLRD